MTNDVDTLATALYATTDDMLKEHPDLAPWRPPVGITPRLSDAELVTLATMQAILGYTSEAKWLRHARAHLRHLFPYLPQQPGYNKRLRKAAALMRSVNRILAATTSVWSDDVWVVDSTPMECGRSRETVKRCSDLAGWAEYGYCASHSRFFWGLRLHLVCTLQGLPIAFALTGAKADERETLLGLLAAECELLRERPRQTLIGDKNYFGRSFERQLSEHGVQLLRPARSGWPRSGRRPRGGGFRCRSGLWSRSSGAPFGSEPALHRSASSLGGPGHCRGRPFGPLGGTARPRRAERPGKGPVGPARTSRDLDNPRPGLGLCRQWPGYGPRS
ncbi:hypothetical protein GCM10010430_27440 [Kitasatospora cystarginea]|uniref:Transposase IS4-like domain-containing protein n=1 Tax=Kitasatospora cystarginea TaxID=58350 RepID=A0ABP5QWT9_9ACTN